MNQITPFQFEAHQVRVVTDEAGELLFVGKDVCLAIGYSDHNNAMKQHCKGVVKRHPLQTPGGTQDVRVLSEPDVLRLIVSSNLPAAQAFEKWVFEDVLPSIRKTGSYTAPQAAPIIQSAKEFKALFGVARLLGMDKNASAISANQAVAKRTGTNMLQLLGATHLENEQQVLFFTPTELGKRVGVSGRGMNMLLAEAGLQAKQGEHWAPLDAAEGFCRVMDTGKRHGDGTMIQQVKWSDGVLPLIQQAA